MNKHHDAAVRARRRWRSMVWSMMAIVFLAMALPSAGYLFAQVGEPTGEPQRQFSEQRETNPRSDMWRDGRRGEGGFTTQTGPYVTNQLMTNVGENYRQIRQGPLMTVGGWFLVAVFLAITAFYLLTGQKKIDGGRTGRTIVRWKAYERFLHWFNAICFIILAITGLSLLFGRTVLIPIVGHQAFSSYAEFAYGAHNFVGPAFSVGVLVMIVLWARHNIPKKHDWVWFKEGGGIIGNKHPPAGKMNGGEKVWFWVGVFALGLTVIITGLIALFPNLGFQTREIMSWALIIHATAAILWMGLFLGHAYIGTLGTEGALEGMTRGRVDVAWAKQHHDLWYEDVVAAGEKPVSEEELHGRQQQGPAPGSTPAGERGT
ncbi:formate dehydrogenase subunit gamma [Aquisalimonas sp.]|uniref:formate dehydrogenase subunit gamma n=1 Tax=Aquisalimonas sp. TaxID=1872621 RepID=UPI0025C30E0C|nr:formate dehydrogenase subunit gamma [Aquisalimonas sp.]